MPPKAAPPAASEVKQDVEGPPFITVLLGLKQTPKILTVNINCPVPIVIDFAKRKFVAAVTIEIKRLKEELVSIRAALAAQEAAEKSAELSGAEPTPEAQQTTLISPEVEKNTDETLKKYEDILASLMSSDIVLDLINSSGVALECHKVNRLLY